MENAALGQTQRNSVIKMYSKESFVKQDYLKDEWKRAFDIQKRFNA